MAGFFDTLFGGGAEKEAAEKNRGLYNDYRTTGTQYVNEGYNTARGDLGNALGSFTSLSDLAKKYGGGTNLYLDALGANGPAGNARATSAFQTGPGYDFTLNSGLDALNQRRALAGGLNSGGADMDAIKYATGLADNTYGDWLTRLGGFVSPELAATSGAATGQAGVYGGLAGLATQNASDKTNILGSTTTGLASANNLQAQGEAAGAKNLLGFGTDLAKLAVSFSDRRLKSNINRIGTTPHGLPFYEYTIFGERQRGVMADEVEQIMPDAVLTHPSGYKMVNYGMLGLR